MISLPAKVGKVPVELIVPRVGNNTKGAEYPAGSLKVHPRKDIVLPEKKATRIWSRSQEFANTWFKEDKKRCASNSVLMSHCERSFRKEYAAALAKLKAVAKGERTSDRSALLLSVDVSFCDGDWQR